MPVFSIFRHFKKCSAFNVLIVTVLSVLCLLVTLSPLFAKESDTSPQNSEFVTTANQAVPVFRSVDVLVLGGTTSGVAAASESAKAGAQTMLVTRFNYLGDDLTATLRMEKPKVGLKDPLLAKLFNDRDAIPRRPDPRLIANDPERLSFSYSVLEPLVENHQENKTKNRLTDGSATSIIDTLQTRGPMTVILDLQEKKAVGALAFVGFLRSKLCVLESVEISGSDDGLNWQSLGFARQTSGFRPAQNDPDIFIWKGTPDVKVRYIKAHARHNGYSNSVMAGEIVLYSSPEKMDRLFINDEKRPDSPPRPLYVKHLLDEILLQSKVEFLYGTYILAPLVDESNEQRGVLIGNRAGCQAILAKKVLDCRFDRSLNLIDSKKDATKGVAKVEFTVIGGTVPEFVPDQYRYLAGREMESLTPPYYTVKTKKPSSKVTSSKEKASKQEVSKQEASKQEASKLAPVYIPWPIYRYVFTLKDPKAGARAFAGDVNLLADIESEIRLASYDRAQQFTSDVITPLFESNEIAAPLPTLVQTARSKGKAAALKAKKLPFIKVSELKCMTSDSLASSQGPKVAEGEICELLDGVRSYDKPESVLNLPKRYYPVAGRYDVIVVGGGTTGCPAAIASARAGAKTLVIDLNSELGGLGTVGSVTGYYFGNRVGFSKETVDGKNAWLPAEKSNWWLKELTKAGGKVLTGVLGVGTVVAPEKVNGRTVVKGVLVATDFGPKVILASVVIDSTGSGDLARCTGAPTIFTTDGEITVQGAGLSPRGLSNFRMNNDYMFVDDTDPIDFTHAYVYGKVKYSGEFDQGKMLGTRERRRIFADFNVSPLDLMNGRTYSDTIVQASSDFDSHGYTIAPFLELYHPIKREQYKTNIPYRCSLPQGVDGLLVGGLATGSHRDSIPLIRMQADLQNQGYALGYIAANAVKNNVTELRKVDIKAVQRHLIAVGNLPETVLSDEDNYESRKSELAKAIVDYPGDARQACLIAWYPQEAIPLLKKSWQKAENFETKSLYAKSLAALGDGTGESTLLEILKNTQEWDPGWNFKSYQQFGSPMSPLDKTIMMLGRIGSKEAVPYIVNMLDKLSYEDDFSHHRACYLALEAIGDQSAAPALVRHLAKPGMTGYSHHTIGDAIRHDQSDRKIHLAEQSRRNSLKEIGAARTLYHLGDVNNIGRKILEQYSTDLRGHFARHAAEILKK